VILLQAGLIFIVLVMGDIALIYTKKITSEKVHSLTNRIELIIPFIALTAVWFLRYGNIGLIILDIGVFLNMVVVLSNSGYMPVDMNAFKRAVCFMEFNPSDEMVKEIFKEVQQKRRHVAMSSNTKLNILGDKYGHNTKTKSIGDIFINIGIPLIILEVVFYLFGII